MKNYVRVSLETHLFFARIMKEHSLFLQAAFASKDVQWIRKADFFRRQFEDLHRQTVRMSNNRISNHVLNSQELVTKHTMDAERKTSELTGLPIDRRITAMQKEMQCGRDYLVDRDDVEVINRLNKNALALVNGVIEFKENILNEVKACRLFTTNYPLLLEHILREAKLYREMIECMMKHQSACHQKLEKKEDFWNTIMMEHSLFIRGLLDPSEGELICTADNFAHDFQELLDDGKNSGSKDSLAKTRQLRDFKEKGVEGILNCQVSSLILPLLNDHVLREANYYIRILEHGYKWQEG